MKEFLLRKKKSLSQVTYDEIKALLLDLEEAIQNKKATLARNLRKNILNEVSQKVKKNAWDYFNDWVLEIGMVVLMVTLINQLWFQLYQIPSGSMRPMLMEKDRLVATKTNFGINLPFKKGHLYFNPNQLHRGNMVILQNDQLPKKENKSRYLFLFPVQKQFVKRLIGKPGDVLYFYGGKIYGLDKDNKEITEYRDSKAFESLEHIPFSTFEGKVLSENKSETSQIHSPVYLYQIGQLVGKLYMNTTGSFQGKFYNGSQWVDESPHLSYQDLWGIRNYGMLRLLSQQELKKMNIQNLNLDKHRFALEIHHSPHVNFPKPHIGMDLEGRLRPKLSLEKSYIPLTQNHLSQLKHSLTTARFVIHNGLAGNYSLEKKFVPGPYAPSFKEVPDGTYEFIDGVGYQVNASGMRKILAQDHPLNASNPELIQKLFNLGMQMLTLFDPSTPYFDFVPRRYGYFRNGDFYVMGHPLLKSTDPTLISFLEKERAKVNPFVDHGPPLKPDGSLDKDLILNYGLSVPKGQYLFLGDNHAVSYDCRSWGFIPETNIQGSPVFIIWPPSSRMGPLNQNSLTLMNGPTLLILFLAVSLFVGSSLLKRKQREKSL